MLAEHYPKCFFEDPKLRQPLKKNILADLQKDGAPAAYELLSAAVAWYQSNYNYEYALQVGAKRIDLDGRAAATVTEQEAREAKERVRRRKEDMREHNEHNPIAVVRQLHARGKISTDQLSKITAPPVVKEKLIEKPIPKAVKPNDPLTAIGNLLAATRSAYEQQPEPLRRPFLVAGLRVVIKEIEKTIKENEAAEQQCC